MLGKQKNNSKGWSWCRVVGKKKIQVHDICLKSGKEKSIGIIIIIIIIMGVGIVFKWQLDNNNNNNNNF